MIEFQLYPPDAIANLPQQMIDYLQKAIDRTPASVSRLDITLDMAQKGYGSIYAVLHDGKLTGAAYILVYDRKEGKAVSPFLVGGDNLRLWQDELFHFIVNMAKSLGGCPVYFIARRGWLKRYPMCKIIGHIYEYVPSI